MTQGLARVEELFEARLAKNPAEIADLEGVVSINQTENDLIVRVQAQELLEDEYYYGENFDVAVKV